MGIAERTERTGSGWAAAVARWRAGISKSQQCHRTRGWLGRRAVGATPVGSTKGYGKRNFPQVRRTQLRLGRADAAHSGCPKHPPHRGVRPRGFQRLAWHSQANAGTPQTTLRHGEIPSRNLDGDGFMQELSLQKQRRVGAGLDCLPQSPENRSRIPMFPQCWGYGKTHDVVTRSPYIGAAALRCGETRDGANAGGGKTPPERCAPGCDGR